MKCPICGGESYVSRKYYDEEGRRTRTCLDCGRAFETVERLASDVRLLDFKATCWQVVKGANGGTNR